MKVAEEKCEELRNIIEEKGEDNKELLELCEKLQKEVWEKEKESKKMECESEMKKSENKEIKDLRLV